MSRQVVRITPKRTKIMLIIPTSSAEIKIDIRTSFVFHYPIFELLSFFNSESVSFGNDGYNAHYLPQSLHEFNINRA